MKKEIKNTEAIEYIKRLDIVSGNYYNFTEESLKLFIEYLKKSVEKNGTEDFIEEFFENNNWFLERFEYKKNLIVFFDGFNIQWTNHKEYNKMHNKIDVSILFSN